MNHTFQLCKRLEKKHNTELVLLNISYYIYDEIKNDMSIITLNLNNKNPDTFSWQIKSLHHNPSGD